MHAANDAFAFLAVSTVGKLSAYALSLSAYSSAYVASKSGMVDVNADGIVRNVTFEVPGTLNATLQRIRTLGDELVACTSLRGDEDGQCPGESARALVDESRQQLDLQLRAAREGFEAYEATFVEYSADVDSAYANMVQFYQGAMQLRARAAGYFVDNSPWTTLTLGDFQTPKPTLPSSTGILDGLPHAMTAEEIWEEVSYAHLGFEEGVAAVIADVDGEIVDLAREWNNEAAEAVANISFTVDLDDFDPPRFDAVGLSIEGDTDGVEYVEASVQESAAGFLSASRMFLDSLGPPGFNISFPVAPPLVENFTVGETSSILASPLDYIFLDFPPLYVDISDWLLLALGKLGVLLMIADYAYRGYHTLCMFIRFWSRASLGVPDADLRVEKAPHIAIIGESWSKKVTLVILHPLTKKVLLTFIGWLVVAVLSSIYMPLLADYRAGCIDQTQNSSWLGEMLYTSAYNYSAWSGNRERWIYTVCF